jgi:hypothetical protein
MEPYEALAAYAESSETPIEAYDPAHPAIDGGKKPPDKPRQEEPATRVAIYLPRPEHLRPAGLPWLTGPPPPVPNILTPTAHTAPQPTLDPVRVMGPLPPPPIPVEAAPGVVVEVPHFAIHVSRRYKVRVGNRRWTLRFDRTGRLRSSREVLPQNPESHASRAG